MTTAIIIINIFSSTATVIVFNIVKINITNVSYHYLNPLTLLVIIINVFVMTMIVNTDMPRLLYCKHSMYIIMEYVSI